MDDKDLIKRTKNSLRAGMSRAQIMKKFQERGYKLEYADAILNKAKRPKKVLIVGTVFLIFFLLLGILGYGIIGNVVASNQPLKMPPIIEKNTSTENSEIIKLPQESEIEITPELISYILQLLGASDLHRNPLTLEKPIVGFEVSDNKFYSQIGNSIETFKGTSEDSDIIISISNLDFKEAILSENPEEKIKNLISQNKISVEMRASEAELFSKGYLKFYNSLK